MFNLPFLNPRVKENQDGAEIGGTCIRLLAGLGNPNEEHENTYHNAGFLFVDSIIENRVKWNSAKTFEYAELDNLIYIKPTVFMNNSGRAIRTAMHSFGINPSEILIVHDDSDLELGKYKLSSGGSSGGHKGVESIIKAIGTSDFLRLRIGIRTKLGKAGEFILQKIDGEKLAVLENLFLELRHVYFKTDGK